MKDVNNESTDFFLELLSNNVRVEIVMMTTPREKSKNYDILNSQYPSES